MIAGEWGAFAILRHVGTEVIDPDFFGIALVGLATGEEEDVRLHALGVEDAGGEAEDGVEIALLHEVPPDVFAHAGLEEDIVREDDGGASASGEATVDVLDEAELLVAGREGEVRAAGQAAALLRAEGRIGKHERGLGQRGSVIGQGIAIEDAAVDAMEHKVHEREAMRVLHMLHAKEGIPLILLLLGLREAIEVVVRAQVVIGRDGEAAGACGGVLDDVIQGWLHDGDHTVNERARGEVLACAGLFLVGVLFEEAFIHVAKAFLLGGIPVELVDLANEGGEGGGLLDEGGGVGEDLLGEFGAFVAEVDEGELVELKAVRCALGFQISPAIASGDLLLSAGLLRHLQEEEVGEFGDVLVIGHAVVLEDVAEVPELGDDVVGH